MPCKHEGGTDPCIRISNGDCRVRKNQRSRLMHYDKNYATGVQPHQTMNVGCAGEHLVMAELLAKQLSVGIPLNPQTAHDMFVRIQKKWWTIQVKVGKVNRKTGTLSPPPRRGPIHSDLLAVVDVPGKRIRWISNTYKSVPVELTDG